MAAQIVPAAETDLPAIARLAGEIWHAHYPGIISREQIEYMLGKMYALETLRQEMTLQAIRFEKLMVDGELAGFASYGPVEPARTFKLHKLYVKPRCHGRGLGSMLLAHCEREAARLGATRLMLAVNKRNTKAIAAYQRNGYATVDSIIAGIGSGFVMDDYIMAKELGGQFFRAGAVQ
ncbi:MAG TPA: GNAT family N-acetyltransferase [Verrucomicrobiae bacterium]|jgi:ribosomal protein S18 acetylase RimI-like enzyme